jgi:hypothetical protein
MQFSPASVASSLSGLIPSSAPYPRTPSTYILPVIQEVKFHTHVKKQINCDPVYINSMLVDSIGYNKMLTS